MNQRIHTMLFPTLLICMLSAAWGCGESETGITDEIDKIDEDKVDVIDEGPASVGTGSIRGLLVDQGTKQTLRNSPVQLVDSQGEVRETVTSRSGVFEFANLPVGQKYTVVVELDGYDKHESVVTPAAADETVTVTVNLAPTINEEEFPQGDGLSVGTKAPNFELKDGNGKAHSLADYAGKQRVVLLFDRGAW